MDPGAFRNLLVATLHFMPEEKGWKLAVPDSLNNLVTFYFMS
jgi:hypothetical protein